MAKMLNVRGFTLVELIMALVIMGILAVYILPRFFSVSVYQERGFADQVQAALRYAQKIAIAKHRFVCVGFTNNSVTLSFGATNACGTQLASPTGSASYVITAPSGTAFTATPANFNFDALGRPSASAVATIDGTTITVEAETGYVHQ